MNDQEIVAALQDAHKAVARAVSLLEARWHQCQIPRDIAEKSRIGAILFGVNKCPWLLREALGMFDVTPEDTELIRPSPSANE